MQLELKVSTIHFQISQDHITTLPLLSTKSQVTKKRVQSHIFDRCDR